MDSGSLDSPVHLNVTLAGDIPFVTQNLAAKQLGVATWEKENLAAGDLPSRRLNCTEKHVGNVSVSPAV